MIQSIELPTLPAYVPHGSPATARIVVVRSHGSPCGETGAGTRVGAGAGMATGVGWSAAEEGPPPQPEARNAAAATVARRRARTARIYGAPQGVSNVGAMPAKASGPSTDSPSTVRA